MKVLLTGGTGFLGKEVLKALLADPRLEWVNVVSRQRLEHPDPRVRFTCVDLSSADCTDSLMPNSRDHFPDRVLHLAGLYDFSKSESENYTQNVISTRNVVNLAQKIHATHALRLIFASSYSVAAVDQFRLKEAPLPQIGKSSVPYALTKALAEKYVTDSGLLYGVYRLGILVNAQEPGARIERLDGPYLFLDLLQKLRFISRFWPWALPVPVVPDHALPLIPVDTAAKALVTGLFSGIRDSKVYGLYDSSAVTVGEFCSQAFARYLPKSKIGYLKSPQRYLPPIELLLGKPMARAFYFAQNRTELPNAEFKRDHPGIEVPKFETYREQLFTAFDRYQSEKNT
jgi:nucleoside-diphosphate-sugar epimerase